MALTIHPFTVGPVMTNAYLLALPSAGDEGAGPDRGGRGRAVLIDPGDEPERFLAALEEHDLDLEAIWLTHAHFDHVGALAALRRSYDVPILMHPDDRILLETAQQAAAAWGIALEPPPTDFEPLADGQTLTFGEIVVRCLHTPGHAPGHVAFYLPDERAVFAGDALFRGSIGRTDLPLADHATLLASIRNKLLTLPPDTVVYPGHGPRTTIGEEAATNPFLQETLR